MSDCLLGSVWVPEDPRQHTRCFHLLFPYCLNKLDFMLFSRLQRWLALTVSIPVLSKNTHFFSQLECCLFIQMVSVCVAKF